MNDTIFAPATAAGRAAVAIMRVSGPGAAFALERLAGVLPPARQATVRALNDAAGHLIDQALVLWMPGPASFTGEDSAELQVHGSPVVLEELSVALSELGLRSAERGEFSRRAFANGKLDLLQAEAIADLVDAETVAQKRQALLQMSGDIGRRYEGWRDSLIRALALIEAENDFPDEDLPGALAEQARPLLETIKGDLRQALFAADRGQRVRDGYKVALIGAPNAGKSSLFNAMLQREAAIVSRQPGTTRDVVEADLHLAGYLVTLADTAGVRDTSDEVEIEGVRRAAAWADRAALRILLVDPSDMDALDRFGDMVRPADVLVQTKADLHPTDGNLVRWAKDRDLRPISVSSSSQESTGALLTLIQNHVVAELGSGDAPSATRARHQQAMGDALEALTRATAVLDEGPERAAEDVRHAVRALHAVTGGLDHEAVLDQVFSSFCIGK